MNGWTKEPKSLMTPEVKVLPRIVYVDSDVYEPEMDTTSRRMSIDPDVLDPELMEHREP